MDVKVSGIFFSMNIGEGLCHGPVPLPDRLAAAKGRIAQHLLEACSQLFDGGRRKQLSAVLDA
jgi:hypothetical protein